MGGQRRRKEGGHGRELRRRAPSCGASSLMDERRGPVRCLAAHLSVDRAAALERSRRDAVRSSERRGRVLARLAAVVLNAARMAAAVPFRGGILLLRCLICGVR
eukprot:6580408-Prymnesium_polylepis.1